MDAMVILMKHFLGRFVKAIMKNFLNQQAFLVINTSSLPHFKATRVLKHHRGSGVTSNDSQDNQNLEDSKGYV